MKYEFFKKEIGVDLKVKFVKIPVEEALFKEKVEEVES